MPRIFDVISWLKLNLGKAGFSSPYFLTPGHRDLLFPGFVRVENFFPQSPLYTISCLCVLPRNKEVFHTWGIKT